MSPEKRCGDRNGCCPIISWQIEVGKVKGVTYFLFLGFRITVDNDCSYRIKNTCSLEGKLWQN